MSQTMNSSEDARRFARAKMQPIDPTQDRWFANAHVLELARIIPILLRNSQNKDGEFCVLAGVKGTAIERIHRALADRLITGQDVPGYTRVRWLDIDPVLAQAEIPGANKSFPTMVLETAFEIVAFEKAVLVVDNAQTLESSTKVATGETVEGGALAALKGLGAALVVMLYREREPGAADQSKIANLEHAHKVPAEPYSIKQTYEALFPNFAAKWSSERGCVPEEDAFDTLFALEPWIVRKGAHFTLPYLAIFAGKDASVLYGPETGHESMKALASAAKITLTNLRLNAEPGIAEYFSSVFDEIDADLDSVTEEKNEGRTTADGRKILTRGHVMANLLGGGEYRLVLPGARPQHADTLVIPRHPRRVWNEGVDSVLPPLGRQVAKIEKVDTPSSPNGTTRTSRPEKPSTDS